MQAIQENQQEHESLVQEHLVCSASTQDGESAQMPSVSGQGCSSQVLLASAQERSSKVLSVKAIKSQFDEMLLSLAAIDVIPCDLRSLATEASLSSWAQSLASQVEVFAVLSNLIAHHQSDLRKGVQALIVRAHKAQGAFCRELERVAGLYQAQMVYGGVGCVIGVDEVGRGPLAGPLTVAAIELPLDMLILGLNDSKKVPANSREKLAALIARYATSIGLANIEPVEIDAAGMGASLRVAMRRAVASAGVQPDTVLIDGNTIHAFNQEICIVSGDAMVASIAAASIVAKVHRDLQMCAYDQEYPEYHFASCKGYGSAEHIEAIQRYGLTPLHRRSFCKNIVLAR